MKTFLRSLLTTAAAVAALAWCNISSAAGVIFLIGSDVVSFHGDTSYINPFFDQLGNFGTKDVLFLNNFGKSSLAPYTNGNVTFDFKPLGFLTSTTDLSPYSGVFIDASSGCCSDAGPAMSAGGNTKLAAFSAAGGSVAVGDYQGNAYWDAVLGFAGLPGVTSGAGGVLCEDPGLSTPGGLAFGFNPSYTEGCFVHQTYDPAFWTGHGFFALQTDGAATSRSGDFVTMATGFADPGHPLPEPSTLALLAIALFGAVGVKRSKQ